MKLDVRGEICPYPMLKTEHALKTLPPGETLEVITDHPPALVTFPLFAAYSASKAAAHSLTQAARAMLKGQGTQVFGVYPGPIDTRMAENLPLDKTSPAEAAAGIVAGIEAGDEDIFPDPMSRGMGAGYYADPKAVERQVAAMAA